MPLQCSTCRVQVCRNEAGEKTPPRYCPMAAEDTSVLDRARAAYQEPETRELARASAVTESAGYCKDGRIQEVMGFARRLGVNHLGVAHCIGFVREADLLREILEANGFEVETVCCKVGQVPKEELGVADAEKLCPGGFESACNPIAQAELLNEAGTGLNIAFGLCVGHDSLFFRHSNAPVTVLVAKDRVTGHNAIATLYLYQNYRKVPRPSGF